MFFRGWRWLVGGVYFKFNNKCQNLVIFTFKIRMKHKFSLSISQIQLKNLNVNDIFIISLFVC